MLTIQEITRRFRTQGQCLAYLEKIRWPDGIGCLRCGSVRVCRLKCRKKFECGECGYQFSATVGTIFHNSKIGLPKWFLAIHLLLSGRKGYPAAQLSRDLGLPYKTAWSMGHRIRLAMKNGNTRKLTGIIEMDETYLKCRMPGTKGQVRTTRGGSNPLTHATVFGMRQRKAEVRLSAVPDAQKRTLLPIITENVRRKSMTMTDEAAVYSRLSRNGFRHRAVTHTVEYVDDQGTHVNGVESVWAVLKRGRYGVYHKIGRKYLQRYLNEFEFRLNAGLNGTAFNSLLANCERGFNGKTRSANPVIENKESAAQHLTS